MRVVVIPASRQSDGDRANMAQFPTVFTDGTCRMAVPSAEQRTKGERENLPAETSEARKICLAKKR